MMNIQIFIVGIMGMFEPIAAINKATLMFESPIAMFFYYKKMLFK